VQRIIRALKEVSDLQVIYFANNGGGLIDQSLTSGADVLGCDWRVRLNEVVRQVQGKVSIQGNMEPLALFLPPAKLEERIKMVLDEAKGARGHIFNLGHGIVPETDPEQAKLAVHLVHTLSRR
jgi:uroporphyrinogen decarboxylase